MDYDFMNKRILEDIMFKKRRKMVDRQTTDLNEAKNPEKKDNGDKGNNGQGLALGLSIGLLLGLLFNQLEIGLALGLVFGMFYDEHNKKKKMMMNHKARFIRNRMSLGLI